MDTGLHPACGILLRRYRRAAGLTQEDLAERADVSVRTIRDLERGVVRSPRHDTIQFLATALELSGQELAGFTGAARRLGIVSQSVISVEAWQARPFARGLGVPPLVGREPELAVLERHLTDEGPPLFVLAGEPGMGKTRLVQAVIPRAVEAGLRVLAGGCQPRDEQEAFAPILGALQRYIRTQRPAELRTDLQGCAWLVRLLPELADGPIPPLPTWTLTPAQERRLTAEAVIRYLANVAGPSGTLLVLDDLQWADPDALDLLALLVRSAAEIPLRVIGAYRDTELHPQDPLVSHLADLAAAELATRRALRPLAPQQARELLDLLLEGSGTKAVTRREGILQRTGGVPFFLVSCAQCLQAEDGSEESVPWNVAQSIRQRVAALPAAARQVLGTAAVVGRTVPRALLVGVATQPEEEVLAAFDAACQARLLEETTVDAYQFVHDVIREVVEGDLGGARRRVLHRRVAEVCEQTASEPTAGVLAYHYVRSDMVEKAVPFLEQAGDRAEAQYAHASAASYYRQLIDLLDRLGWKRDTARTCEKLGVALSLSGRYDAALPVLERALEAYRLPRDLEGQRRTLAQIGWLLAVRGTSEEDIDRIESLLHTLDPETPSPGLAALYVALGHMYGVHGRYRECLTASDRAVKIARQTGDSRGRATAEAQLCDAFVMLRRFDEALHAAEAASRLAEQAGDLPALSTAYQAMIGAHVNQGEYAKARIVADCAVKAAEQLSDPEVTTLMLSTRAWVLLVSGEWDLARVEIERAVALGREIGRSGATSLALLRRGVLCLREGDWDRAAQDLEECVTMAQVNSTIQIPWAQRWLAELDLLMGHPDRARRRLIPFLDGLHSARPETVWITGLRPMLAWAYLDLGEFTRAKDMVAYSLALAQSSGDRSLHIRTLHVQAMAAVREERWSKAAETLEEGLLLARGMPDPYEQARLLQLYGLMHRLREELGPARTRLEHALGIYRRLGAKKDVEFTVQQLSRLD